MVTYHRRMPIVDYDNGIEIGRNNTLPTKKTGVYIASSDAMYDFLLNGNRLEELLSHATRQNIVPRENLILTVSNFEIDGKNIKKVVMAIAILVKNDINYIQKIRISLFLKGMYHNKKLEVDSSTSDFSVFSQQIRKIAQQYSEKISLLENKLKEIKKEGK